MFANDRDEINFHKFLKSVRKSQGVSMEKVALGVCTKSEMSRIENGTRLPEKLVRDRLTARLGISGEEYEEYLLPREYEQWERRMEIIRCINKKDVTGAEEKITEYRNTYHANNVDIQFSEAMQFMVLEMKGVSEEELFIQVGEALKCTVPDMDAALDGAHPLADQEINLIMEYIRLKTDNIPEANVTEWKLKEYNKIVTYVKNSRMDKIAQAKVYSKVACFIANLVLAEYVIEESLRYALELCTCAIEVLRDTFRLYYFVELNEYRMQLCEKLLHVYLKDMEKNREINEIYRISDEWGQLFNKMYVENKLPVYMQNFTYLYTETECNNVCDVIRVRRAMIGGPRRKFCGQACDEKTLYRIEKKEVNPSMAVVRDLFEKMGICAEYKRARVVTSDADVMYLSQELFVLTNNFESKEASVHLKKLYKCVDMDIPYNEQEIRRQELMVARMENNISNKDDIEQLTEILECTLSLEAMMSSRENCFTRTELACVHDFAAYTVGEEQIRSKKIMEELCFKALRMEEIGVSQLIVYELIMNRMASIYGNEGQYEESDAISSKLLKECLRNRRMNSLAECEYNKLWNYQQKIENIDKSYVKQELKRAYLLSELAREVGWKDFFQQKINELS